MIASSGTSRAQEYNGKVTIYVVLSCIVGACTGLVFGYGERRAAGPVALPPAPLTPPPAPADIGVAGGVASFPEFKAKFFPSVGAGLRSGRGVGGRPGLRQLQRWTAAARKAV